MKPIEEIIKPYKKDLENTDYSKLKSADLELNIRWKHRIPPGWYGFDGINELWGKIIDEFLIEVEKECPDFQILQQKLKFGGFRCYLSSINNNVQNEIDKLEDILFNERLIY